MASDENTPGRWTYQGTQDMDGCGFTGAIGSNQPKKLAFGDVQEQRFNSLKITVFFPKILCLDCKAHIDSVLLVIIIYQSYQSKVMYTLLDRFIQRHWDMSGGK
jgi:hypothetical protein